MSAGEKAAVARAAYVAAADAVARGDRGVAPESLPGLARAAAEAEANERREVLRETWTSWSPPIAPHVQGRWTQRLLDDAGLPEEQRVEAVCSVCKAEYKRACTSGLVRGHIQRFALVHAHPEVPRDGK